MKKEHFEGYPKVRIRKEYFATISKTLSNPEKDVFEVYNTHEVGITLGVMGRNLHGYRVFILALTPEQAIDEFLSHTGNVVMTNGVKTHVVLDFGFKTFVVGVNNCELITAEDFKAEFMSHPWDFKLYSVEPDEPFKESEDNLLWECYESDFPKLPIVELTKEELEYMIKDSDSTFQLFCRMLWELIE